MVVPTFTVVYVGGGMMMQFLKRRVSGSALFFLGGTRGLGGAASANLERSPEVIEMISI